jgi:putative two-component system response regulator
MVERVPTVLVVDDEEANRDLVGAFLEGVECQVLTAADGCGALHAMEETCPDLILLDVRMPGMDGFEVCRRLKANPRWQLVPVVMITGLGSTQDRVEALEAGAIDFMVKPIDRTELIARVSSMLQLRALYKALDGAEQVVFALAAAVEARDPFTGRHAFRVAEYAKHLGRCLELDDAELSALYRGSIIHDLGKIGISDAILLKPGPLDPEEAARMKLHTVIGEAIVSPLRSAASLLPIVRSHHERVDGQGYPDGLEGTRIPEAARIVSVCDAYDALVNDRPYRERQTVEEAVRTLTSGAGSRWDSEFVDLFVSQLPAIRILGASLN